MKEQQQSIVATVASAYSLRDAGGWGMRLPQGPWFPWSGEFRWDRFPWQGDKRHELEAIRDQRDLALLVEAAASTIGVVARQAGFTLRHDVCGVNRDEGPREIALLYEAAPNEVTNELALLGEEHDSCVDLWVYWSPDTGLMHLSLPGALHSRAPEQVDRDGLYTALQSHADEIARQLGQHP